MKEILSAILDKEVIDIHKIEKNTLWYKTKHHILDINIHELTHLMKEWALGLSYQLESSIYFEEDQGQAARCEIRWHPHGMDFHAKTEFEAVTKACEWILNERV